MNISILNIKNILFFLCMCCLANTQFWANSKCNLPEADQQEASVPQLVGFIRTVNPAKRKLRLVDQKLQKVFEVDTSNSEIFGQFGGSVHLEKVLVGKKIELWTKNCLLPPKGQILAARIRVSL